MSLIPLTATSSLDEPLFPLHPTGDAELLNHWHGSMLPSITSRPAEFEGICAAHLFRQGLTEQDSVPTILVSVSNNASESTLREKISSLVDEPLRQTLRISFEASTLRRTALDQQLPPICKPRNTSFKRHPDSGVSIGIKGKTDCTATLGGFLEVDGRLLLLTVDHLIPDDAADKNLIFLTHPSEQESVQTAPWRAVQHSLAALQHCCGPCRALWKEHTHHGLANAHTSIDLSQSSCPQRAHLHRAKAELARLYPTRILGAMVARSKMRSRLARDKRHHVEMDWALFGTDCWPHPLNLRVEEHASRLRFSEVVPGARVKASGRTSGEQVGVINTALSLTRHGRRFTQEWAVCRDAGAGAEREAWIEGGIGVDGDSGAWIVDREDGRLYGMAWGRDRVKTEPITLFMPIGEVVADIKEVMSADEVKLSESQDVPTVRQQRGLTPKLTVPIAPLALTGGELVR